MLVEVVQLRLLGVKRSRDDVRATTPVRGHLQLGAARPGWFAGQRDAPLLAGLVTPGTTAWALPPLDHACVRALRGNSLVITGVEEMPSGRAFFEYRQAWWCRLVGEPQAIGRQMGTVVQQAPQVQAATV